jgi:error-prone DNA polymerase
MAALFADKPHLVRNAEALADRLRFTLDDLPYQFPDYPLPPGETNTTFLRAMTDKGARDRYRPYHEKARRQIERELALIEKLELEGYFLIVWDIVNFCRAEGILVQGRGSAANSAVCYSLGLTAVDPGGDGPPLRAIPLRGTEGMAGHRPRPAQRRPARGGDPARLPQVRRARGGHDGGGHHLSREERGPRDRQGPRHPAAEVDRLSKTLRPFEYVDPNDSVQRSSSRTGSTGTTAACSSSRGSSARSATCRATSASTRAGW